MPWDVVRIRQNHIRGTLWRTVSKNSIVQSDCFHETMSPTRMEAKVSKLMTSGDKKM
jgi:hypothetical protein